MLLLIFLAQAATVAFAAHVAQAVAELSRGDDSIEAISVRPVLTEWEYRIESPSDTLFDLTLNRLGEEGWELAFARRATARATDDASYEVIFKRPSRVQNGPP